MAKSFLVVGFDWPEKARDEFEKRIRRGYPQIRLL
jgi:hypothetical protein